MRNRSFAILSGILALLLIAATAGVFIYRGSSGEGSLEGEASQKQQVDKRNGDPDGGADADREAGQSQQTNDRAVAGNAGEGDRGPLSAAQEDYEHRAYPLEEVAIASTEAAQATFNSIRTKSLAKTKNDTTWTLLGPINAIYPAVLNRTGTQYIASGRITALAIASTCQTNNCRLWVAAAGGGIWRTDQALAGSPRWTFISGSFGTNAIGTLTYDAAHNTLYAGTGEPNASGDSEAGVGIYKSTDGGDHWTLLPGSPAATKGRSVSSIVVDPTNANTIYVSTTRGVRGVSSVTGGATSNPPGAPPFGLYKSTDGGSTFSFIWNGNASLRGVNHVELDPSNTAIVYAAAFQQGVWRSTNGGASFSQIFAPTSPAQNTDRSEFAVTKLPNNNTRMYVGDGAVGPAGGAASQFFRTDDAAGAATFAPLTSNVVGTPGYATYNYCTGQCWYDNMIFTPAGQPDTVYVLGSYLYNEAGGLSNARAVLYSTDAGATFTDMTRDASSDTTPNGIHPDQHAIVVNPNDPNMFFEGSDGGLMRSSGAFSDISYQCDTRGLTAAQTTTCKGLLSRVPSHLYSLNRGLATLQFQSLSINGQGGLQGGTQDNGTWDYSGSVVTWLQEIYGDGGQSGFDAANPNIRFNTFFGEATDTNFQNGDPTKWVVTSGPLENSPEGSQFYMPIIADPVVGGSMFAGLQGVWRTLDNGGNQAFLEANCPEFTTSAADPNCGDWVELGGAAGDLTKPAFGPTRAGGVLAAVERAPSNHGTLWAASATGRVFISQNADAANANSVTYTRLDTLAPNSPGRFVSSIFVDPTNPNHAWLSYSGYSAATPATPGHVFSVTYNPTAGTATWTNLNIEGTNGDLPVTDLVEDANTGTLYAATDFGVLKFDGSSWSVAGNGLPNVEVPGLTIDSAHRTLYAATHGLAAWKLTLP